MLKIVVIIFFIITYISNIPLDAKELVIIYKGDWHGRIESNERAIGYARLSTFLKSERTVNKNLLFLDAGDTIHGTMLADYSQGELVFNILSYFVFFVFN